MYQNKRNLIQYLENEGDQKSEKWKWQKSRKKEAERQEKKE